MYLVRNIFYAKPGSGKALIKMFKEAAPYIEENGVAKNTRILVDAVASFWTVIIEEEVEDLNGYLDMAKSIRNGEKLGEIIKNYTDLITGGKREVFRIE